MICSLRLGIPEITYYSFRSNTYKVILQYCRGLFPVQPRIFKSADVKVPYIEWHRTMHTVGLLHLQIPNCESKLHFLIVVHWVHGCKTSVQSSTCTLPCVSMLGKGVVELFSQSSWPVPSSPLVPSLKILTREPTRLRLLRYSWLETLGFKSPTGILPKSYPLSLSW